MRVGHGFDVGPAPADDRVVARNWRIAEDQLSGIAAKAALPHFTNISARLGMDTFDQFGGVVIDDFDGDDRLDVLTSTWDPTGPMHLFHNEGDGRFTDVVYDAWRIPLERNDSRRAHPASRLSSDS